MLFFMFNSQSVMCIKISYIFAPEYWIQSVQAMAKLMPMNAFSAVKWCKNTWLSIGSSNVMKKPSQNDGKTHVSDN